MSCLRPKHIDSTNVYKPPSITWNDYMKFGSNHAVTCLAVRCHCHCHQTRLRIASQRARSQQRYLQDSPACTEWAESAHYIHAHALHWCSHILLWYYDNVVQLQKWWIGVSQLPGCVILIFLLRSKNFFRLELLRSRKIRVHRLAHFVLLQRLNRLNYFELDICEYGRLWVSTLSFIHISSYIQHS